MDNTTTIRNIQEFTQQIINGNLILTRIIPFIDEMTLFQKNLRGSTITECKINNVNNDIKKYKKLLINLYSTTDTDMETILQNTILNISQQEIYDKGFKYYTNLGISIQGADARRTLKEIINIIKIKNYSMELKIKLQNGEIIRFILRI
jgi:CRISPR/Cas system CSM-associated protein Csm4 (group 5 of RAMP superfamily)